MILAFNPKFVEPILNGTKIHTIRQDKPNRWKSGKDIHFATGVRTKNYNQFKKDDCKSVQQIEIIRVSDYFNETIVKIEGRQLNVKEVQQLASNDGFEHLYDFLVWFADGFTGKIIHWTDFKY